jgi:hypothetical protein
MLGLDSDIINENDKKILLNSNWMLYGLIIHAFNLKNGMKCNGFDEEDPITETNLLNLPADFVSKC